MAVRGKKTRHETLTFILVMVASRGIIIEAILTPRYFGITLIVLGILLSSVARG